MATIRGVEQLSGLIPHLCSTTWLILVIFGSSCLLTLLGETQSMSPPCFSDFQSKACLGQGWGPNPKVCSRPQAIVSLAAKLGIALGKCHTPKNMRFDSYIKDEQSDEDNKLPFLCFFFFLWNFTSNSQMEKMNSYLIIHLPFPPPSPSSLGWSFLWFFKSFRKLVEMPSNLGPLDSGLQAPLHFCLGFSLLESFQVGNYTKRGLWAVLKKSNRQRLSFILPVHLHPHVQTPSWCLSLTL